MKILFLSIKEEGYSRTSTYFSYLKSQAHDCDFFQIEPRSMFKDLRRIKAELSTNPAIVVVGSASQLLVIPITLVFKLRPFLDAGWSLFESTIVTRERAGRFKQRACKAYLIDLAATIFSCKVFLESHRQVSWYKKVFFTNSRKCVTLYTGVDEAEFNPGALPTSNSHQVFKIVFRGRNNEEAGLDVLAKATRILSQEDVDFLVISNLDQSKFDFSARTRLINEYFKSKKSIAANIIEADLSLGQLSNHPRLGRTIPHKAFESAFLGIPYLTARNFGILEVFQENLEIFCFDPGSAEDLAAKIMFLKSEREKLLESGRSIKEKYSKTLSQKVLSEEFLRVVTSK
jgi:glycosyltransferase involved in cell wall biosynthesis